MKHSPRKSVPKSLQDNVSGWCRRNIDTIEPAIVVSVREYDKRLVDVLPVTIREGDDGSGEIPTVIQRCPVLTTASLSGHISVPLELNDVVAIGYCKYSNDEVTSGVKGQFTPDDRRVFGKGDVVVLGYWAQFDNDKTVSTSDLELRFKESFLRMTPDNALRYTNPSCSLEVDGEGNYAFSNGSVTVFANSDGTGSITSSSDFTINGVTFTSSGEVTIPSSLTLAGKEIADHDHAILSGSSSPGPTGPNN